MFKHMKRMPCTIFSIIVLMLLTGCSDDIKGDSNNRIVKTKNEEIGNSKLGSGICPTTDTTSFLSFSWVNVPKGWCASDIGVADSTWGDSQENNSYVVPIADSIFFNDIDDITGKSIFATISYETDDSWYELEASGGYQASWEERVDWETIFASSESNISMSETSENGFPATRYKGVWKKEKCVIILQTIVSDYFSPPYKMGPSDFLKLSSEMLNNTNIPIKCYKRN